MCGVGSAAAESRELVFYKGTLVREILDGVLSNAKTYQEARESYMTDPLTGVGTRKMFEESLEAECERSSRYHRPFCLAILDVDNFKTVNDELGHATGDQVLREVAQVLNQEKRSTDILARYGGDEFAMLLPETELDAAVPVFDRMRNKVQAISLPQGYGVSLSGGVAEQLPEEQEPASELFRRADLALYEAKKAGRNCTRTWRDASDRLGRDRFVKSQVVQQLQGQVNELSAKVRDDFVETLWGFVRAIEARDPYTSHHSENVMRFAVGIAEAAGMSAEEVDVVRRAAMIHDIGMIGVPDAILRKPGKLTPDERAIMEQHPRVGVHILQEMRSLEREIPIVRHHHERWDGQGYPSSISGTRIPRTARILAVADALDGITSDRSHRCLRPLHEAVRIIRREAGAQFDPEAVEGLARWIETVAQRLGRPFDQVTTQDLLAVPEPCAATV